MLLEREQAEQLVAAGRHGQLLGRDPLHAALHQHAAEPVLHRPTSGARARPGPAPAGRTGRRRRRSAQPPTGVVERLGERVRGVGRQHDRAHAGGGAAAGRGGGDRRLADAALARVEDRPGRVEPEQTSRWACAPSCSCGLSTSTAPATAPGLPARSRADQLDGVRRRACAGPASRACAARGTARRRSACARASSAARDPQRDAGDLRRATSGCCAVAPAAQPRGRRARAPAAVDRYVGEVRLGAAVDGVCRAVAQRVEEVAQQRVVAEVGLVRDRPARVQRPGAGVVGRHLLARARARPSANSALARSSIARRP